MLSCQYTIVHVSKLLVIYQVMGLLAAKPPEEGHNLSGVLIKRGFNYHLIDPSDLSSKHHMTSCDLSHDIHVHVLPPLQVTQSSLLVAFNRSVSTVA